MAILVSLRYLVKEDAKLASRRQNAVCVDYLPDSCKLSLSSRGLCHFTIGTCHMTSTIDMEKPKNDAESLLSADELRVLALWQKGDSMTDSYKKVMLSPADAKIISKSALHKRVVRFFATHRMREAMAATQGERGVKARKHIAKWQQTEKSEAISKFAKIQKKNKLLDEGDDDAPSAEQLRQKWLQSLQVTDDPTAMSIYGTGLFLAQMAIMQIMKRKKEIDERGMSALERNASPYTAIDISALKTAAAMILPFAPPPTTAERRAMSLAGVMIGLAQDDITESPDDYTAPPPSAIDVKVDKK